MGGDLVTTARELGLEVLAICADQEVTDRVAAWEAAGARWIFDPQVPDVLGLIEPGTRNRALVVVYVHDVTRPDFELAQEFFNQPAVRHELDHIGPDLGRWTCTCGDTGVAPFVGARESHARHAAAEADKAR